VGENEKIVGYVLLVIGIITIVLTVISVYAVFTKRTSPVSFIPKSTGPVDVALSLPDETGGTTKVPLEFAENPLSSLNDQLNAITHLILMSFIASAGYKLASLGTKLIRPIVVKAKS